MFTGKFSEAQERKIRLRNVVSDKMPEILNFIYTGHIEIAENTVEELLHDAHYLQVKKEKKEKKT